MEGDAAGEGGGAVPTLSASLGLSFAMLSGLKAVRPASSAEADTVHTKVGARRAGASAASWVPVRRSM